MQGRKQSQNLSNLQSYLNKKAEADFFKNLPLIERWYMEKTCQSKVPKLKLSNANRQRLESILSEKHNKAQPSKVEQVKTSGMCKQAMLGVAMGQQKLKFKLNEVTPMKPPLPRC